jgi:hypothetical protein
MYSTLLNIRRARAHLELIHSLYEYTLNYNLSSIKKEESKNIINGGDQDLVKTEFRNDIKCEDSMIKTSFYDNETRSASFDQEKLEEEKLPMLMMHVKKTRSRKIKEGPFNCTVEGCGRQFKLKWIMLRHTFSHSDVKRFVCGYQGCAKGYKSKENLTLHQKNIHMNVKPYACDFCNKRYSHRNGKD